MSRLADPTICPDCRGALDPDATCTVCGLGVRGPAALQLWSVMLTADRLVEQLRGTPAAASVAPSRGATSDAPLGVFPAAPAPPPARPRRLASATVPVVLLSLGALCLLVAAVVFVVVTWSLLGLTGRTLVLLGVTGLLAVAAVALTRRGLRVAAETFWLIVAGMLTVDLLAAQSAGLAGLDALSWRGTGALVGGALLCLGLAAGTWARRQPVNRLYGAESVAVLGGLVLCAADVWSAENAAIASTLAVPVLAALFVLLRRAVRVAAYGLLGLGALTWLVLLGIGWDRATETASLSGWWADLHGWPLLAAAAFAAVVVHLPGVVNRARPVAAGLALLPLVLLANGPRTVGVPTRDLLVACACLVVLGLVAALAATAWSHGAAALTAIGIAFLGLWLVLAPWDVLTYLDPHGRTDPTATMSAPADDAAAWSFAVAALALVLAAACALRRLPRPLRRQAARAVSTVTPAVLALGVLVMVLELEPPLWAGALCAGLVAAVAGGAAWSSRDHLVPAVLGSIAATYLTVVALYAASAADVLTAIAVTTLFLALVVAGAMRDREGSQPSAALLVTLAALAGGWALVSWGQEFGADLETRALALAVYAGVVGLVALPLTRRPATRVLLESAAALLAVLALLSTGSTGDERAVAMVLTVIGTAICALAVTARDREPAGWLGAAVLGGATVLRVTVDVQAPEIYTLPAAALLLGAGVWRLRQDSASGSLTTLGSGLSLAMLPSLLLAMDEPVSVRGALVAAAAVLILAAGVHQRLAAPFVLGAVCTGVLALRHLEPVADAVPRWISLGGVGLVLLLVGVTWEARRRDLAGARRYLIDLR